MECTQSISYGQDQQFLNYLNNCESDTIYPPLQLEENDSFYYVTGLNGKQISILKLDFSVILEGDEYNDPNQAIPQLLTMISTVNANSACCTSSRLGAVQFKDTEYTTDSRLSILADTPTNLPNNKESILVLQEVPGVEDWIDDMGKITPPNANGDGYMVRGTFTADPAINNRNLTVSIVINGGTIILAETKRLARGAGIDTLVLFVAPIYTLNAFFSGGGVIVVECDGDIEVYDINLFIYREYKGTVT